MSVPLPAAPSLEQLRKQAKDLLKSARAGSDPAIQRLRAVAYPAAGSTAPATFRLSHAQLAVAREYGFPSWPKLVTFVETVRSRNGEAHRPFRRDLGYYDDRAAGLLSVLSTGQERALSIVQRHHPRFARASLGEVRAAATSLTIDDARLVLAREHGLQDWPALARRVGALARGSAVESFLFAFEAMEAGSLEHMKALVALDPSLLNARGTNGNGLLNLATAMRRVDIVGYLLDAGADPNLANNKGWTPLHQAAYGEPDQDGGASLALLQMLLEAGARVDLEAHGAGGTPLAVALFWGHRPQAEALAERGVLPRNLRVAAGLGRVDVLDELVLPDGTFAPAASAGREFHRPHSGFPPWTPSDDRQELLDEALVYAAKSGRIAAMDWLVERGADVNGEPYKGTALHWAVARGRVDAARWLLDHGADVNRPACYGGAKSITPLHCAAWAGNTSAVEVLVEAGADITARDPVYHGLPLGWAEHNGRRAAADLLLELGSRRDVLHAAIAGRVERVRALVEADPAAADRFDGWSTPLIEAARLGRVEVARYLLERGADAGRAAGEGRTALSAAEAAGHEQVAAVLRAHTVQR